MNIICFFIRKIMQNKVRLFLTVITFSLSLFLAYLFLTLGINGLNKIDTWFDSNPDYRIIYAETTDKTKNPSLKNYAGVAEKAVVRTGEKQLICLEENEINVPVTEYSPDEDLIIPGEKVLFGRKNLCSNEVLLGKSILIHLKIDFSNVIGKEVMNSDSHKYKIIGVFDDTLGVNSCGCIALSKSTFESKQYILKTKLVDEVSSVVSQLENDGYKVVSNAKDIADTKQYLYIVAISVVFFSLLVLGFASIILYFSLRQSITEMNSFLAILKAFGYKRKECSILILGETSIIFFLSSILTITLYYLGMVVIKTILLKRDIVCIYGFYIEELFTSRLFIIVGGSVVAFCAVLLVALFSIFNCETKQVYDILNEAEQ